MASYKPYDPSNPFMASLGFKKYIQVSIELAREVSSAVEPMELDSESNNPTSYYADAMDIDEPAVPVELPANMDLDLWSLSPKLSKQLAGRRRAQSGARGRSNQTKSSSSRDAESKKQQSSSSRNGGLKKHQHKRNNSGASKRTRSSDQ